METIMSLVQWITSIVTIASIVAASTPTPKDDEWIKQQAPIVETKDGDS